MVRFMPSASRTELLAQAGFGSAIIEARPALQDIPSSRVIVGKVISDVTARRQVARYNPLCRLPTSELNESAVSTESAAITTWLSEGHSADPMSLVAAVGKLSRPNFLSWFIRWVVNFYATLTHLDRKAKVVSDFTTAQQELLKYLALAFRARISNLESAVRGPWFFGDQLIALTYAGGFRPKSLLNCL